MKSKSVLVVDDDDDILDIIKIILEDEGYEVSTLSNGRDVVKTIVSNRPDLILLDVMLCGMDGREICKNLKTSSQFKLIPIIMISASHNLNALPKSALSPNDFIPKPFDIDKLITVVNSQFPA